MSRPDAAMLFGAGLGTRMAPLTATCPKPLIEVAGRPLFDHALDLLRGGGVTRIVANTHYRAEQMSAHLALRGVIESHEPVLLDTGGGLKRALPLLRSEVVLTLNTDAVWTGPNPVPRLLEAWDPARMEALMLLMPKDRATGHRGRGDFQMASDGRLTPGTQAVYTGLQVIRAEAVDAQSSKKFGLYSVWSRMIRDGKLYGLMHRGGWCDVGRPDSITLAESLLETGHV